MDDEKPNKTFLEILEEKYQTYLANKESDENGLQKNA